MECCTTHINALPNALPGVTCLTICSQGRTGLARVIHDRLLCRLRLGISILAEAHQTQLPLYKHRAFQVRSVRNTTQSHCSHVAGNCLTTTGVRLRAVISAVGKGQLPCHAMKLHASHTCRNCRPNRLNEAGHWSSCGLRARECPTIWTKELELRSLQRHSILDHNESARGKAWITLLAEFPKPGRCTLKKSRTSPQMFSTMKASSQDAIWDWKPCTELKSNRCESLSSHVLVRNIRGHNMQTSASRRMTGAICGQNRYTISCPQSSTLKPLSTCALLISSALHSIIYATHSG
eukprot:3699023-Amphidinium_carterae.1